MDPTALLPVIEGVWRWSVWNEPRKLWFNGHVLEIDGQRVVIDPVDLTDEIMAGIGPASLCVVTNRDHARAATELCIRTGARLLVPAPDAEALGLRDAQLLDDGDLVAGALRVVAIADAKSPGELALFWPERKLLVLGDAAVGKPRGSLTMLPDDKFADAAAARAGVAALASLDVEIILVGDGDDLLASGAAALASLAPGAPRAPANPGAPGC